LVAGRAGFDLAIFNADTPGIDRLRARLPGIPVIALTRAGYRVAASDGKLFVAVLSMPLKAGRLAEVMTAALSNVAVAKTERASEFDTTLGERVPLRILVAEDNPVNQKVALRLLEKIKYQADVAGDGIQVLDALRRQSYDVVLMDVQMPRMDGLEATRAIRRQWPGTSGPVVIAMTANAFQDDREECLAAGMDDYLPKPIRITELQAILGRLGSRALYSSDVVARRE
jgi:CheY-like chemotaxis protein